MPFECVEDPRGQLRAEIARRSRSLHVQEAILPIVIMLREHDCIWTAIVSEQPQSVLEAPLRFTAADVDVFELPGATSITEWLCSSNLAKSVTSWRYCARMPTKFCGTSRSPKIIEGRLQVGLLAKGIGTRSRQDLLWAEGRKVSSEPETRSGPDALRLAPGIRRVAAVPSTRRHWRCR